MPRKIKENINETFSIQKINLKLNKILKEQWKTQADLIRATWLSPQTVSNICRWATDNIKLSTIISILEYLDISFDELTSYEINKKIIK